jgi:MFS family permease
VWHPSRNRRSIHLLALRGAAIAAALIGQTLHALPLTMVGGIVAARVERRRILVRSCSIAALTSYGCLILSGIDVRMIWMVFPIAAVVGASAFTHPSRQSMLRSWSPRCLYSRAPAPQFISAL